MEELRRKVARERIEHEVPGWDDINEETQEIMVGDEVVEPVRWDDRLSKNDRFAFTKELLSFTNSLIFKATTLNKEGQMAFDRWLGMAAMDGDHTRHVRTVVNGTWIVESELTAAIIRGDAFHAVTRRLLGPITDAEKQLLEQGTAAAHVRDEELTQEQKDTARETTDEAFARRVQLDREDNPADEEAQAIRFARQQALIKKGLLKPKKGKKKKQRRLSA